ncbi:NAD(P)H-binding protein [Lentzea sp. BCCO 10_0856]|uniref:NAD(P)H-binding protein n=1 Tax=Lentzea miocenica TaxID=3095431 RepID=A0ABU4TEE9_9PSEU|nr:NAD(P)H-binding protein [Lentzea sp. BCCO 10_0856]MDX8036445.1 NAD(P)H-binding protein [Lentzea sp. BCCO 10_0856]
MKIAVVGAAGMVGSRVVTEAVRRGHDVTAVFRGPVPLVPAGVRGVRGDATDRELMDGVLSGVDGVVAATRPRPGEESAVGPATRTLLDAALATRTRILVVGGAAPLRAPGDSGLVLDDNRYVPTDIRPIAAASVRQFEVCRAHAADWVYLSPPALLEPGERTGGYRRGGDVLLTDPSGASRISAEDLAVAVLDELANPSADRHFTVGY